MSLAWYAPEPFCFRFGAFEFDGRSLKLSRRGRIIPLRPRPAQVLSVLLSAGGGVVTHEDLQRRIWGQDVHVDLHQSLKGYIKQVRRALGDDARDPRFIETLPRCGYRFMAPVHNLRAGSDPGAEALRRMLPARWRRLARPSTGLVLAVAAVFALTATLSLWESAHSPDPPAVVSHTPDADSAAYPLWHEATRLLRQDGPGDIVRAVRLLHLAEIQDPEFARASATLALAFARMTSLPPSERYRATLASAERALALDRSLADAFLARGLARFAYSWDWPGARADFEQALSLDPQHAAAHAALAWWFASRREFPTARQGFDRALAADPSSSEIRAASGWAYYFERQYARARNECAVALRLQPELSTATDCIVATALATQEPAQALVAARARMAREEASRETLKAFDESGPADALRLSLRFQLGMASANPDDTRFAGERTLLLMMLGETERALETIITAVESGSGWYLPFLGVAPLFGPLRGSPDLERALHALDLVHDCTLPLPQPGLLPLRQG